MRILVTGASGRIGNRIVEALLARNQQVTGLDLAPARVSDPGFRHVQGAFDDPAAVAVAMQDASAVLHVGALMAWTEDKKRAVFAANVTGTFTVLEAAVRAKVGRFVFASSGEVYPEMKPLTRPITEDHPLQPIGVYGLTKLLGEQMVRSYGNNHGLPFTILRFSNTQDATELLDPTSFFSGPRFFLRERIRQQEALGRYDIAALLRPHDDGTDRLLLVRAEDGSPYRAMMADARDIARGVLLALDGEAAVNETFNLHGDEQIYMDQVVARLSELTGLPVTEVRLPGPPVDYLTSNAKLRERLGFAQRYRMADMMDEAVAAWRQRQVGQAVRA